MNSLPLAFWVALGALATCGLVGWFNRGRGWGLPLGAVAGTVAIWYVGDAVYNNYNDYLLILGPEPLDTAWWQVALFGFSLLGFAPVLHHSLNQKFLDQRSSLIRFLNTPATESETFQNRLDLTCKTFALLWCGLMAVALFRTQFDFTGLFMPYIADKAQPWIRGRVGGGLDALFSLAAYLQIFLTASFGVIAALSRRTSTRWIAFAICFFGLPAFLFDRARNAMIAVLLPGFLAWVFIRIRRGTLVKAFLLLLGFAALESWLRFVIENRDRRSIAAAYQILQTGEEDEEVETDREKKHLGLNMLEELGWINAFIESGRYQPNWGARYFAELVNPIPRAIWKNKPLIGIDYAIARGFASDNSETGEGGVVATISTGMIGQGVVNFGRLFGPVAAAFIMALWICLLARLDLQGDDIARLVLYMVGMVLTFNMGRDITLLVLYPFVFGYLILLWRDYQRGSQDDPPSSVGPPPASLPGRRRPGGARPGRRRYHH